MKKTLMAALLVLALFNVSLSAQAAIKAPAVYVALGDSLAAGQTPDSKIDAGYADLIAQELSRHQPVALYTKQLAFPGFTTEDVLERIKSEQAQEVLASANIITLSAGANDLLRLIQSNPEEGSLAFQQIQVDFALNEARLNMEAILAELKERAPNADVYVMGYYFAYPHARENQKEGTAVQLERLNEILKNSAKKAGAAFVSVDKAFGKNATNKVPSPGDVHPNLLGYQAMANAFLDHYQKGWKVEKLELPKPNPMTFEEIQKQQEQQREQQEGRPSSMERTSARPSEQMVNEYLALREPLQYI
ncbi:SGNH/GDSL hydrolase family protein [Planomicrobium sp. CPCC 101079]|uniref:SGNH/GDSL hydrolase family protein n=1 Tax=Planomicrobium sp. CPCC 101079 TaxID=2599618 RepID=UPI0011B7855A|nr:SGNH/GDSL hydrolase family protein [Planomicrobium sp. CPCC 101079]TWT13461.1 SGNH/GDSL hydrolase family protein [Planomicrobium sp. CPCC 101079]